MGKPVLNLDYLLCNIVQEIKRLDWATFWHKQSTGKQVLKVSGYPCSPAVAVVAMGVGVSSDIGVSSSQLGGMNSSGATLRHTLFDYHTVILCISNFCWA